MSDTVVDLLRHGEPEGGTKFRGNLDDKLSDDGWKQMWTAVNGYHHWNIIVTSPLKRCADFAMVLASKLNIPINIEPNFKEISFGIWEGLSVAAVQELYPNELKMFWKDPITYPIPKAELVIEFEKRVKLAWDNLTYHHKNQHILLVTHGGVIRVLLRDKMKLPINAIWQIDVPYAAIIRLSK